MDEMTGPENPDLFIVGGRDEAAEAHGRRAPPYRNGPRRQRVATVYQCGIGLASDGRVAPALLVHVLQDALSTWSQDPVSGSAMFRAGRVPLGRDAGRASGHAFCREIRHESRVANPREASRAPCGFLGGPHDDAMARSARVELGRSASCGRAAR
jgi:hypothetical protein